MMEQIESQKVICEGGLNSNINHIQLSDTAPGSAIELINFESSLYGGYRRLSGFTPLLESNPEVDPTNAEGKIFLIAIFGSTIITARKQKLSNTYNFYYSTGSTWSKYTTGVTRSSVGLNRIRYATFNFNGTEKIIFVDGVNPAIVFDGTNWFEIKSTNTGASTASAGGNQVIDSPSFVEVYQNHIFLGQNHLVVHSSPLSDYDWTAAGGAGQLPAGFLLTQIKTFRDYLYVFGTNRIKRISVNSNVFVYSDVTSKVGCIASDTVQEIGGDLIFLSQDGFRPISGTNKIGDVNIEILSKKIQLYLIEEIKNASLSDIVSVLVRSKSQIRVLFSQNSLNEYDNWGVIGCLKGELDSIYWEWGKLKGIKASCATSDYIGATEYVLHGGYDGIIYKQEEGNNFGGKPIQALYKTPFLDFGLPSLRKTSSRIKVFFKLEGSMQIACEVFFDWNNPEKLNPNTYTMVLDVGENVSVYDSAGSTYDGDMVYGGEINPVVLQNIQGSGHSMQLSFSTIDTKPAYTIQGMVYEFNVEGRK